MESMHRLLVVLLLTQGCAFGIDGPDPNRPRSQLPKCDTGKGAVTLDGTVAALSGVIGLSLVSDNETSIAMLPFAIGALYATGAIVGNRAANRCREANADFEAYLATRDATPPRGPVRAPAVAPTPTPAAVAERPAPPAVAPVVATEASTPAPVSPAAASSPAPAAAPRAPAAASDDSDDEWSAFWREVP